MSDLPMSGGPQPMECVYCEGSAPSEIHMLSTHSTLYNTLPNMPSTTGEYHNEAARGSKGAQGVAGDLMFHQIIERP